jgi:hypothetical protein
MIEEASGLLPLEEKIIQAQNCFVFQDTLIARALLKVPLSLLIHILTHAQFLFIMNQMVSI